jgi:hypothetical protein
MMRKITPLLLTFFAVAASAAEVNLGPEYEIRPQRFAMFGPQSAQSVASNGRTYVAVWIDSRYDAMFVSRLDASGNPTNPFGNLLAYRARSAYIAAVGNSYLLTWKDPFSDTIFAWPLDEDGNPTNSARAVVLSAGAEILGFVSNGSTYLLTWRAAGSVAFSILNANGSALVTKTDGNLGAPIAIGARGRNYVYIDSLCSTNCARIVTITEAGDMSARTVIGAGLSNSFARGAFSPDRILLVAATSYLLIDYDGNVIAAERLAATPAAVDAGWDGRQFIVFLIDAAPVGLRGIRVTSGGTAVDQTPFAISRTYVQTSTGLKLVPHASDGMSFMGVWSDTHFSSQIDVVAQPFASFDDLAAAQNALMLVTYIDEKMVASLRPKHSDVRTASAKGHLLAVWAEPDGVQASLDGTQIELVWGTPSYFPVVAAGNESFLVVWYAGTGAGSRYLGRRIGFDGSLLDAEPFLVSNDRLAPPEVRQWSLGHDGTNFVFVWAYGGIRAARIAESGVVLDPVKRTLFTYGDRDQYATPALARTNTGLFAAWLETLPLISLYGTPLADVTASQIHTFALGDSSISTLSAAFAGDRITYAWVERKCVTIAQFTIAGELLTAPRTLDCGSASAVDIAWNGSEHVVAWTEVWSNASVPGRLRVLRIDRQGNPIDAAPFEVSPTRFTFAQPSVTATAEGVIIAYTRAKDGEVRAYARTLARLAPDTPRRRAIGRSAGVPTAPIGRPDRTDRASRPIARAWAPGETPDACGRDARTPRPLDPDQLRVLGDELLRAGAVEVDRQLRVGTRAFHGQDGAVAELLVADPHAALQLRLPLGLRARGVDGRRIELHRRVFEEGEDALTPTRSAG